MEASGGRELPTSPSTTLSVVITDNAIRRSPRTTNSP